MVKDLLLTSFPLGPSSAAAWPEGPPPLRSLAQILDAPSELTPTSSCSLTFPPPPVQHLASVPHLLPLPRLHYRVWPPHFWEFSVTSVRYLPPRVSTYSEQGTVQM